jgi:hypothetical protein
VAVDETTLNVGSNGFLVFDRAVANALVRVQTYTVSIEELHNQSRCGRCELDSFLHTPPSRYWGVSSDRESVHNFFKRDLLYTLFDNSGCWRRIDCGGFFFRQTGDGFLQLRELWRGRDCPLQFLLLGSRRDGFWPVSSIE